MTDSQTNLIGALVLAYFVSRITLRLPNPLRKVRGIVLAHGEAFAAITLLLMLIRGSDQALSSEHLLLYLAVQTIWLLIDLLREHSLGWRSMPVASGD